MHKLCSERICQQIQEKSKTGGKKKKNWKTSRWNASSVPELGETWSCGNASEVDGWDTKLAGRRAMSGNWSWKIASEWNHKPGQKWGFADLWPSVLERRILSNEIYAVKQVHCQVARLLQSGKKTSAATQSTANGFNTDILCVVVATDTRG